MQLWRPGLAGAVRGELGCGCRHEAPYLGRAGAAFSLDLVHPSSQGHRLLPNEYIGRINALIMADQFFWLATGCQAGLYHVP
jgi:hypothetical protein